MFFARTAHHLHLLRRGGPDQIYEGDSRSGVQSARHHQILDDDHQQKQDQALPATDGDAIQRCGVRRRSNGDDQKRQNWQAIHSDVFRIVVRRSVALPYNYAISGGEDRQGGQYDAFAFAVSQRLHLLRGRVVAILRDPFCHADPLQYYHSLHKLRCLQLNRHLRDARLLLIRNRAKATGNSSHEWNQ